ncbi:hypothetical protein SAMN05661044_02251 [Olivibacter domesticus]|uniref:Uncharacterized protein n=1 Tax=Olivibacter domesticus TaxID=407022 RepID=A0A1H7PIB2_OLID1|nr:hypothetical protein SAMN05661044_02251 [Olivibacter domesticus]
MAFLDLSVCTFFKKIISMLFFVKMLLCLSNQSKLLWKLSLTNNKL